MDNKTQIKKQNEGGKRNKTGKQMQQKHHEELKRTKDSHRQAEDTDRKYRRDVEKEKSPRNIRAKIKGLI